MNIWNGSTLYLVYGVDFLSKSSIQGTDTGRAKADFFVSLEFSIGIFFLLCYSIIRVKMAFTPGIF